MAKTKDYVIDASSLKEDMTIPMKKFKYNTLYFKGFNSFADALSGFSQSQISQNDKIIENSLVLNTKINGYKITLKNYFVKGKSPIKNLKIVIDGQAHVINLLDTVNNSKNGEGKYAFTNEITKAGKIKGTVFNDIINASDGKDTIKAGGGNDTIYASLGNDTIIGGKGNNTVIYDADVAFGKDVIKLTKGETLNLNIDNFTLTSDKLSRGTGKGKNDLIIKIDNDNQITLKNYYGKNTKATVIINDLDLTVDNILKEVNAANYFEVAGQKPVYKYTGSALADTIDASGLTVGGGKNRDKGVTITGGAGNDTITGSRFADVLKAGSGTDSIEGGKGNDKLYSGTTADSETTFIFSAGDGNDTVYSGKGRYTLDFGEMSIKDIDFSQGSGKGIKNLVLSYNQDESGNYQDSVVLNKYYKKSGKQYVPNSLNNSITTKEGTYYLSNIGIGSDGADIITTGAKNSVIFGNKGDDTINYTYSGTGGNSHVFISKGDGNDTINGPQGATNTMVLNVHFDADCTFVSGLNDDTLTIISKESGKDKTDETLTINNYSSYSQVNIFKGDDKYIYNTTPLITSFHPGTNIDILRSESVSWIEGNKINSCDVFQTAKNEDALNVAELIACYTDTFSNK